jgi:hypothetical protein
MAKLSCFPGKPSPEVLNRVFFFPHAPWLANGLGIASKALKWLWEKNVSIQSDRPISSSVWWDWYFAFPESRSVPVVWHGERWETEEYYANVTKPPERNDTRIVVRSKRVPRSFTPNNRTSSANNGTVE